MVEAIILQVMANLHRLHEFVIKKLEGLHYGTKVMFDSIIKKTKPPPKKGERPIFFGLVVLLFPAMMNLNLTAPRVKVFFESTRDIHIMFFGSRITDFKHWLLTDVILSNPGFHRQPEQKKTYKASMASLYIYALKKTCCKSWFQPY